MLVLEDITIRIAGRTLLEGATARIATGHRAGLVGPNGTGKTTLLRAIMGEVAMDSGSVETPRGSRIGTVAQEAPTGPMPAIEAVLAADTERADLLAEAETATDPHRIADIQTRLTDIGAHAAPARAATILDGLGIHADRQDQPCSAFSGGWRMRIALAAALFAEPEILLLDEPTNHLDLESTLWLEDFLQKYRHTVIIVSHDRDLLNRAVTDILHLDQLGLTLYSGNYDSFEERRRMAQRQQADLANKQAAERAHIQSFVDRFRYKASKARQAQSRLKMLAKMQPVAAVVDARAPRFPFAEPQRLAPPIVSMESVDVGYEPGRPVLRRVSLRLDDDDRIALLGANGNGKSTLAKLIAGRLKAESGKVSRSSKLKIGFFAQHQIEDLKPGRTALDHIRELRPYDSEAALRTRLDGFGLDHKRVETPAAEMSGGEKARLALCLMAQGEPHLIILDEPTNHLDIDSRQALVQALNAFGGAVILVSHDSHLVEAVADRLWLVAGGGVEPFEGDMDDYKRLALSEAAEAARPDRAAREGAAKPNRREARKKAADARAELSPLRKSMRKAEKDIETLTAQIRRIEAHLHDPEIYRGSPDKQAELNRLKAAAERAVAEAEQRWMEAAERLEDAG
ncbi:MAG: glycosyl transferase family 1 [Rhizobiales bacterium NRL2]|jgi:ATP-binding cassette subfamily F protein 3|nr:MAG: glycosyl transferase family 1 [Rhizobiales bacterium NRL2]